MKLKEFRKTNEFKIADIVEYVYPDGKEFDGTHRQLGKANIIEVLPTISIEYPHLKTIRTKVSRDAKSF